MKNIIVIVEPSCISINRELQYIENTIQAYKENCLTQKMEVINDNENEVKIIYHR